MRNSFMGSPDGDADFGKPDRKNYLIRRPPHIAASGMISAGDIIFTGQNHAR
jgi:hypothetical protein